jgi:pimeloyl-ACP methyl ester carboxylesterase
MYVTFSISNPIPMLVAMLKEQVFDANGVLINFAQAPCVGRPVVLLHGVASEWQSFLPLIPTLANHWHVYALDLRGHGRSSWIANSYRLIDYAQDVSNFLRQQVTQPAILYGHSLGALIAIAVTVQSPTLILGLILGDPPLYYRDTPLKASVWYEPFVELHHILRSMPSAQEIDDYIAQHYPKMEAKRRRARANCLSRVDPTVVAMMMEQRHMDGYDPDALLRQIGCPVLLIQGNPGLGAALRDEDVTYMTARLRNCQVLQMQEVGHGLPPDSLLPVITDFLSK